MSELVVVTNRGPAALSLDEAGVLHGHQAAGGLAPSLGRALATTDATWVAVAQSEAERRAAAVGVPDLEGEFEVRLVDVGDEIADAAVRVISNATLWFCHHNLFDRPYRPVFARAFFDAWERYREYNALIAAAVDECADEGATVVVNDYHLSLLGTVLARQRPDLKTVHFSHTPFCTAEELRTLPSAVASELLEGLCAFGACGFHTPRWAEHFRSCAAAMGVATPPVFVSPLGVDADALSGLSASGECAKRRAALDERLGGRKLIVRSDRLELSKNVLRGFLAYEELLSTEPSWIDRVVFVARVYPSREDLPEYLGYRASVEQVVERVNERFGRPGYIPIELHVDDDFAASIAAASRYDVLLVNPLRDGMNLVAKEGPIVNTNDGVLVLSREAGAFTELGEYALAVEPFDVTGTALALQRALTLDASDRRARAAALRELASAHPPDRWFLDVCAQSATPVAATR